MKKSTIYDAQNRESAKHAKLIAIEKAYAGKAAELDNTVIEKRVHSFLLNPYVFYQADYISLDENGIESTKTIKGSVLYPVHYVLDGLRYSDAIFELSRLTHRLELLFTARTQNNAAQTGIDALKKECKKSLQGVFDQFQYTDENGENSTKYLANFADVETMYIFAFKFGKDKDGKPIAAKKGENLLPFVIYTLWSKLTNKGYTLGCIAKIPTNIQNMLDAVKVN
jgi:hypothetical protein